MTQKPITTDPHENSPGEEKCNEFLSPASIELKDCKLHKNTPFVITNVSNTQLSVARFYGFIKYMEEEYIYNHNTDELIRKDVLKWNMEREKQSKNNK